jgi:integrase
MAKIYTRDGDRLWIGFVLNGVQCRESLRLKDTLTNRKHGERLAAAIEHEIAVGTFSYRKHFPNSKRATLFDDYAPTAITIAEALDAWLRNNSHGKSHTTIRDYQSAIDHHLKTQFGHIKLKDLKTAHIKDWIAGLVISNKRINNIMIPLRGMLEDAYIDGTIERNPADKIKNLKTTTQEPDPFTPQEIQQILAACEYEQHRNLIRFAFFTGLRTGELLALRWEDFDEPNRRVFIRLSQSRKITKEPKTKSGRREVPLFDPALEAVIAQKSHTYHHAAQIFFDPKTNKPYSNDKTIREFVWRPTLKRAGVRYRYPYQTRHTFACMMLTAGENPAWIASVMGHSDWAMIRKFYARWMPTAAPNAGDKFKAMLESLDVQKS